MNIRFPFLDKGFSRNSDLKKAVFANFNEQYLEILEKLFEGLFKGGCDGIELKILEIANLSKFEALVSELEFARYFLEKKMKVELLPQDVFKGRKTPDMLVTSNLREYFVEVKSIQLEDESYILGTKIADVLNSHGLSFRVWLKSSSFLATPAYKHQTRGKRRKYAMHLSKSLRRS